MQLVDQFSSVAQLCPTLCNPMNCTTPCFPVHHQLPEPAQTHVHQVSDAIQPSHPLLSPSPPTFSLPQHQGLFQWVQWVILCCSLLLLPLVFPSIRFFSNESGGQSIGVSTSASVLPMNIQDWSPLGWTGWISLQSKGLSSLLQHHNQFFSTQLSF